VNSHILQFGGRIVHAGTNGVPYVCCTHHLSTRGLLPVQGPDAALTVIAAALYSLLLLLCPQVP